MSTLKSRRNAKNQLKKDSSSEKSVTEPELDSQENSQEEFDGYEEVSNIGFKDRNSSKSGSDDSSSAGMQEEEYDVGEIELQQQVPDQQSKVWS